MFGPTPLRDILLVAGFELREMLRSRFAFFVCALYMLLLGAATSLIFVQILINAERVMANPLAMVRNGGPRDLFGGPRGPRGEGYTPPPPPNPAGPSQAVIFAVNSPFRGLLRTWLDGDDDALEFVAGKPAITLFYTFATLLLLPFLVMLTTAESIAQDIQSRRVRFVALRTGRVEFVVGKMLGQSFLIALVVLLSAGMSLAVAAWKLRDFEFEPALMATLLFWPRIVAFCAPFLGLAALCSMNASSVTSARVFAFVSLAGAWVLHHLAEIYSDTAYASVLKVVDFLLPFSHRDDLWYPALSHYGGAMATLAGLGVLYLAIGLLFYRRRDL